MSGIRKADRGLDISEVVLDYAKVTELNNKYFAPVWKQLNEPADVLTLGGVPF